MDVAAKEAATNIVDVVHKGMKLRFACPNSMCAFRTSTFSTKEPETLAWIDGLQEGATFWDVGANVGLYSVYAAVARKARVYAFEPSIFNVALLGRNVYLNGVAELVTLVPLPLSERPGESMMHIPSATQGGALSSFGSESSGHYELLDDGSGAVFNMVGTTMDAAVRDLGLPLPDAIKIDVDGIELEILKGGSDVLRNVGSVILEVDDSEPEIATCIADVLQAHGLRLEAKLQSDLIATSRNWSSIFNQIWIRT